MTVGTNIKRLQNIMRQDEGVDGDAQRIGQLTWLLFLKIYDQREQEAIIFNKDFTSPIPERLRWRAWAVDPEGITGDALLSLVNDDLFPTLRTLGDTPGASNRARLIGSVFKDAYNFMRRGHLLRQVINEINTINFGVSKDRHMLGDMYEQILRDLQSAGNAGEYYTPRALTRFIAQVIDPQLGEIIFDPACGTGGFLACAIDHVREHYVSTPDDEQKLQASIRGIEKKPLPHLLCTTNMLLHGIDVPTNIVRDNALSRPLRDYTFKDRVDVIITNPPFGGTEEAGIETNFPTRLRTTETADLFLVLIGELLKDSGRAGVVLPDGTLFGDGVKARVKEELLATCNLHTIVRLPPGVFNPYAGVRTNLLFFTKGRPTEQIWYYEHQLPQGQKTYTKTKPMRYEEFKPELEWWPADKRKQTDHAWLVGIDQIRDRNYNLDIPNPSKQQNVVVDSDEVLAEYDELLHLIADAAQNLRTELRSTLKRT